MSQTKIKWPGDDIVIDDHRFCHGDNGTPEFYETIIASQRLLLGFLKNHGEQMASMPCTVIKQEEERCA